MLSSVEVCADLMLPFFFFFFFSPSSFFHPRVLSLPLATRSVVVTCVVVAAVQLLLMQAVHLDLIVYLSLDLNAALLRCVALWRALSCTAPVDSRVHPWNTQHQIYTTTFCIARTVGVAYSPRIVMYFIFELTFVLVVTRTTLTTVTTVLAQAAGLEGPFARVCARRLATPRCQYGIGGAARY